MLKSAAHLPGHADSLIAEVDRAEIVRLGVRLIPPDPVGLVQSVEYPRPRQIPDGTSDFERARVLGDIYRAAVEWKYHIQSFAYSGHPRSWVALNGLLEVERMLRGRDIPPAAWVAFSFEAWASLHVSGGPPRPGWVYSASRVAKWDEFREAATERYLRARLASVPEHRQLCVDWHRMWGDLLQARPSSRSGVADIVERHFPGDAFERRLTQARGRRVQLQRVADLDPASAAFLPRW